MRTRTRIWTQILDLDRGVRYFQKQADRYGRRHKLMSWAIVALALGAAAAYMVEFVAYVPAALFLATAGLSAWSIVGKESDYAVAAQVYTSEYQRLRQEAINLWYEESVTSQSIREFELRTVGAASGISIPIDKELNQQCTEESYKVVPHELAA